MKKRSVIISVLGIVLLGGFGLWKINQNGYAIWNTNSINVTADLPLKTDKVKIEFGISFNTISRSTDKDLFKRREKYTVLFDGSVKDQLINEYGENDFLITYGDEYYISFRHFKFNCNHQHDYHFHFFQKNHTIFVRADIRGKDAMKFERPMIPIRLADK